MPDGRDHRRGGGGGRMRTPARVLIVGAGLAGARCAETLRALGFDGELRLVGAERIPPYERPALSKEHLAGERDAGSLELRPRAFWDENGVELLLGRRVTAVDPAAQIALTDKGEELRLGRARAGDRRDPTSLSRLGRLRRPHPAHAGRRGGVAERASPGSAHRRRRCRIRRHGGRLDRVLARRVGDSRRRDGDAARTRARSRGRLRARGAIRRRGRRVAPGHGRRAARARLRR